MTTIANRFPLLLAGTKHGQRLQDAIEKLLDAQQAGVLHKSELDEIKALVRGPIERAWSTTVVLPFIAGRGGELDRATEGLYFDIDVTSLHGVLLASRKLAKSIASGPAVDAMRALIAEALPLAQAAADLKTKAVPGRRPRTEPTKAARTNPNKVVKTCPCCFRPIAVVGKQMAHHGYSRPMPGFQTASCPGIRFEPLEVSSAGLVWLIDCVKAQHAQALLDIEAMPSLTQLRPAKKTPGVEFIGPDAPGWAQALQAHDRALQRTLRECEGVLPGLQARLDAWRPEVAQ